jgi:hypothetical protein
MRFNLGSPMADFSFYMRPLHLLAETLMKRCIVCGDEKDLSSFMGIKREHPWCKDCRTKDPRGAKLVRDRMIQQAKTPPENREHHQRYKERHPERLAYRSSKTLLQQAYTLSAEAIEAYKKQAAMACREQGYTRGQVTQILCWMDELAEEIRQEAKTE